MSYSHAERRAFERLSTPEKIQEFIDEKMAYDKTGSACRSARRVLRERTGNCMEGALMAAAALEYHGHPPLLLGLGAERDDDHAIALFRRDGLWGACAKSNYSGLRFRTPVYRTLRELAMSYWEHYYNLRGEKSLRTYSRPFSLTRFDRLEWRTTKHDLWEIAEYVCEVATIPLLPKPVLRHRYRMDRRLYAAGRLGAVR